MNSWPFTDSTWPKSMIIVIIIYYYYYSYTWVPLLNTALNIFESILAFGVAGMPARGIHFPCKESCFP